MEGFTEQRIEEPHIQQLTKLYDQQRASVHTNVKSKAFHLERGTMQRDPVSTLFAQLTLAILDEKPQTEKWNRDHHGVIVGHDRDLKLSKLMIADNILLIIDSRAHATTM